MWLLSSMAEVGSFEVSSQTKSPPSFERNFVGSIQLARMESEWLSRQATYKNHARQERQEAEWFLQSFDDILLHTFGPEDKKIIFNTQSLSQDATEKKDAPRKAPSLQGSQESSADREKIATYGNLSDLAYADFVQVPKEARVGTKEKLQVKSVQLDPLSFPNIRTLESASNPTENEQRLMKFLQEHSLESFAGDLESFDSSHVSKDTSELLYIASSGKFDATGIERKMAMSNGVSPNQAGMAKWIDNRILTDDIKVPLSQQYASLDPKYRSTLIDVDGGNDFFGLDRRKDIDAVPKSLDPVGSDLPRDERLKILQLNAGLEHVRKYKTQETSALFERMQEKWFSVVDRFPDKNQWDKDSSWFSAIAVRDQNDKMHISVRGTELTDFGDLGADFKLMVKRVPENQTKDLIAFMDRVIRTLPEGEKIRIVGHSLWGALSQLGSVMFDDQVEETYTFNSPWAKKLSVSSEGYSGITKEKFDKYSNFWYTQDNNSVESRITNVRGMKGPSIISNLGNDIWNYNIELENLSSHSITKLVDYVEHEATEKELQKQDTRDKKNRTDQEF